jgi:hypothetical protein
MEVWVLLLCDIIDDGGGGCCGDGINTEIDDGSCRDPSIMTGGGGTLTVYPTKTPPMNGTSHRIKKLPLPFFSLFGLVRNVSILCKN